MACAGIPSFASKSWSYRGSPKALTSTNTVVAPCASAIALLPGGAPTVSRRTGHIQREYFPRQLHNGSEMEITAVQEHVERGVELRGRQRVIESIARCHAGESADSAQLLSVGTVHQLCKTAPILEQGVC